MLVYGLWVWQLYDHAHIRGVDNVLHFGKIHELLAFTEKKRFLLKNY
jgi:hypothetical protein